MSVKGGIYAALHKAIASLSELNVDQKNVLHLSLVAERPFVNVNAAAAVGKTTLAATTLPLVNTSRSSSKPYLCI